jgi:hypothetical protein
MPADRVLWTRAMRKLGSVEEIRAEIQRRIRESNWAHGYCADCPVPSPYRIPQDGIANWTAQVGAAAKKGCESLLLEIVASVRQEYDLQPQSLAGAVERLLTDTKRMR